MSVVCDKNGECLELAEALDMAEHHRVKRRKAERALRMIEGNADLDTESRRIAREARE